MAPLTQLCVWCLMDAWNNTKTKREGLNFKYQESSLEGKKKQEQDDLLSKKPFCHLCMTFAA